MSNGAEAASKRTSLHGLWSSRMAFVLAVSGSAVGLGNIWKFPYITGENGGGAFVVVYLFCVFLVGLPIMMSEVLIGRRGRRNPIATMRIVGEEEGATRHWSLVGVLGVLSGFLILSFYSVIAGWCLAYVVKTASGAFAAIDREGVDRIYAGLIGDWRISGLWHTLFMAMTMFIVARGVERGLERAVQFMMPALLILLIVLLGYSIDIGQFAAGWDYMFRADFGALTPGALLAALGQAFFTLSIAMGAVMAYGAYLPEGTSIPSTCAIVVVADTLVAILAGLVIFPIVIANGLDPAQGPSLLFETLPIAFGWMPGGVVFGTLFFVLLVFAAWTSAIGLIEPAVAWMVESHGVTRKIATAIVGGAIWLLGFATVLSFNTLSGVTFWRGTWFANIDHVTSNIMLPLGGLSITLFAGWVMCRNSTAEELEVGGGGLYRGWRFLARFVAPVAVIFIFLKAVGLLDS